jgi:hypothetical protein
MIKICECNLLMTVREEPFSSLGIRMDSECTKRDESIILTIRFGILPLFIFGYVLELFNVQIW